ncbi:MAG TPA: carboxypeptidase regulatory-like domain-containing protein [Methylomirabilota bacterium]
MPTARGGLATAVVGGKLYAIGGGPVSGFSTGAVEVYDPVTNTWAGRAPMPTPRSYASAAGIGGKIYVVGGCINADCSAASTTNILEVYDVATDTWLSSTLGQVAPMPTPRSTFAVGVINGQLHVVGGMQACAPCTPLSVHEVYDPGSNTWFGAAPMPTARSHTDGAVLNGRLYVVGGSSGGAALDTLEAYVPQDDFWLSSATAQLTPLPFPRTVLGAAALNGMLYAISGQDQFQMTVNAVNAWDPSTNVWTPAAPIPTARYLPKPQSIDGALYVVGAGAGNTAISSLEVFRLPPTDAATQWLPFGPFGPQTPQASAVYDPASNRMIVFGGQTLECGGTFCPASNDVWIVTNANGVGGTPLWNLLMFGGGPLPPPRYAHIAGYDPATNRMIITGGVGPTGFLTDTWVLLNANGLGGPATWQPLFTGVAPPPVYQAAGDYNPLTNTLVMHGGLPNPAGGCCASTDTWVLHNANGLGGAPFWSLGPSHVPGRYGHVAVFDTANDRFIISGGTNETGQLLPDSYVLVDASQPAAFWFFVAGGGPPRYLHRGVYDPFTNQLITFGGQTIPCQSCPGSSTNDIWVLNEANAIGGAGFWRQLFPGGPLPQPRNRHVMAYDPGSDRVIVEGGADGALYFGDTWVLTRASGVDSADLSVTQTAPAAIPSGGTLTYSMIVTNLGPGTATGATLTDPLPAGTTFVSVNPLGSCMTPPVGTNGVVTCDLGDIVPGGGSAVNITVNVTAGGGTLTNTATAALPPIPIVGIPTVVDRNGANDAASVNTTVTGGAPDLVIDSLTHSPTNPTTADLITFTAVVKNVGTATAGASTLEFRIGGETPGTPQVRFAVPSLAPGQSYQVQRQMSLIAQNYQNTAIADVDNVVAESNEGNNQAVDFYTVTATPDLIVQSLTHSPVNPTTVDNITFTAVVQNIGLGPAGPSTLEFRIGGETPGTPQVRFAVPALPPGATFTVVRQAILTAQAYLNHAIADVDNVVAESDEQNNTAVDAYTVTTTTQGAVAGTIFAADTGQGIQAFVQVFNAGNGTPVVGMSASASGDYHIVLASGNYKVMAFPPSPYAPTAFNGKPSVQLGDVVIVPSGGIKSGTNITVPVGGTISGVVTQAIGGAGIVGAQVTVFDAGNNPITGVTTGGGGNYITSYVKPGAYKVSAAAAAQGFSTVFYVNGIDPSTATAVAVTANQNTPNIDVALPSGGMIQGTVLDRATRAPVQNANVFIFRPNANPFSPITGTRTDSTGHYSFGGLHDGLWVVRVECYVGNGCTTAQNYVISYWSGNADDPATDSGMATPILIAGGNTAVADINPTIGGGIIKGRITRSDNGQPVPQGTGVQALFGEFARTSFVVQTATDSNGNYSLPGLAAGPYVIQVLANPAAGFAQGWFPTGAIHAGSALPVVVADGQTVTGKDFATYAGPLFSISGTIRNTAGQPLDSVNVVAVDPLSNFGVRGANVNGDGTYFLNALPPGRYIVRVTPNLGFRTTNYDGGTGVGLPFAAKILTLGPANATAIDFALGDGGTIRGAVFDAVTGFPIAGAAINIRSFSDNTSVPVVSTQRDGTFVLRSVPPGFFKLRVMKPGHVTRFYTTTGTGGATLNEASFIGVAANQTITGIQVPMTAGGGTLAGRVFRDITTIAVAESPPSPVVAAVVNIRDSATGGSVTFFTTRADGSWEAPGLAAGSYKVRIQSSDTAQEYFQDKPTRETADSIMVSNGGLTTLPDQSVSPHFGTLSGTVLDTAGAPVVSASVTIFDASGGFIGGGGLTDSNGRYSLTFRGGFAPAVSGYVALIRALGYADNYFTVTGALGTPSLGQATRLTIADGVELTGIDFVVTKSSDVSGSAAYTGLKTGPLVVELALDAGFNKSAYRQIITSPTFPQAFGGFKGPLPDTRGVVAGTYYVRAFIDTSGNGTFDTGEPVGQTGPITVTEGNTTAGVSVTITDPATTINVRPVANPGMTATATNAPVNIVLDGSDAETPPAKLTYTVLGPFGTGGVIFTANNGSVTGFGQFRTYTPPAGFSGTDSFTFTVTDRGNPDGCAFNEIFPCPPGGGALTSDPATVTILVNTAGTIAFASSVEVVSSPNSGGPRGPQALGDVEIDETFAGSLATTGAVTLTLPPGLTFATPPTVSLKLSNGLTVGAASLGGGNTTASFAVTQRSSNGPGKILVSNISVFVNAGFASTLFASTPVNVSVGGTNPGVTPAQVHDADAIPDGAGPVLSKVTPDQVAQGGSVPVTLGGVNFAANATISTGDANVTITPMNVSPMQIFAVLTATQAATLGYRDVTVTNPAAGVTPAQSSTLPNAIFVSPPPSILTTDRGTANPLLTGRTTQRVNVTGTGFQSPTTSPPNLFIDFSVAGAPFVPDPGIIVEAVGFTSDATIWADVTVSANATVGTRFVRVKNPDGGIALSAGAIVSVQPPPPDEPPTLNNPASKTTTTTTVAPAISGLSPAAALLGASIVVNGSSFSGTPSSNSVTFAGANNTRVSAVVTLASQNSLTVTVPGTAVDGNVTVAVNGQLSNGTAFTATSPRLSSVIPSGADQGTLVPGVQLTGSKFVAGATVAVLSNGLPVNGIAVTNVALDGTSGGTVVTATFNLTAAPLGIFDVMITNPDGGVATLPAAFEVRQPSAVTITLLGLDTKSYLPSVGAVNVTLDANGHCTAKTIVSVPVGVQATWNSTNPPPTLRFRIDSSTLPGTATNEDCEPGQTPASDFTIGADDGVTQTVDVSGAGTYITTLYSRDMGGTVTIHVTDLSNNELGHLTLPVDSDGDGLPDAWETANGLNANNADEDGNGVIDDNDRFARDGLTNFEKYRGAYKVGPLAGNAGLMDGFLRLPPGQRNFFVRGRGYANDPAVTAVPGTCGWDPTNSVPVPDPTLSPTNPCPRFEVGGAFAQQGINVIDVTTSFTPGRGLPRASMGDPTRAILDMATITYDAVNCNGGEACDQTGKAGIRQWTFATLGVSSYGGLTYGNPRVVKRAVESYFFNHPYQHRINDPTRIVLGPDGRPMLAPITLVGDGNDNGLVDRREPTVNGDLAGDTYLTGVFNLDLTAMDVNNDGCVELPNVADSTTLPNRCDTTADSAAVPQATKQQVARHVTTHELGHAVGVNLHTTESDCVMYQYSTDWVRDGHFGPTAAPLLQIHNKGGQQ